MLQNIQKLRINYPRQAANVGSNSSLYSDTKKSEKYLIKKKKVKISKRERSFEGFTSTYNFEILNSFNTELQLKDTEFAVE